MRRPPRSTPFPTRRSSDLVEAGHGEPALGRHVASVAPGDQAVGVTRVAHDEDPHVARRVLGHGPALRPEDPADRKSTRLNSSHTVISYAVFCLKKKKKTNR